MSYRAAPPPPTVRSFSHSTTSAHSSGPGTPDESAYINPVTLSPGAAPSKKLSAPVSVGMGSRTNSAVSVETAENRELRGWDGVDKLGYKYALRVAVLHHHLLNPPVPFLPRMSSTAPISTPPLSAHSPSLHGTSPSGSRLTFFSSNGSNTLNIPDPGSPHTSPSGSSPGLGGRRKSSGFGLLGKKDKEETCKLPKEFLVEFWGTLSDEQGDHGWHSGVGSFLGMVKKGGTKTPSGMNLREIPTLLEAFASSLPPTAPGSAPSHVHQTHFLQLLSNSLPRSSYFSPLARNQTEKDKDLLFRLRAEIQSYMLPPEPEPSVDSGSFGALGLSTAGRRSPGGLALGRTSSASSQEIKRKPSPVWTGADDGSLGEMVETVGMVWGVDGDMLEQDVALIKRGRPLQLLYMNDLRRALASFGAGPTPLSTVQRRRQQALSQTLTNVLRDFPELSAPYSPDSLPPASPMGEHSHTTQAYFSPPRTSEVFGRLSARAAEHLGHMSRSRDLVERCRDVWDMASRRDREKQLEATIRLWGDAVGTPSEGELGRAVAGAVRDMASGTTPGEPLSPVLQSLLSNLLALLTTSITGIFPLSPVPSPPPPPSLLLILHAGQDVFFPQAEAKKAIDDLGDELKAGAVGEYVTAVDQMMGGIGHEAQSSRRVGHSGKDSLIEGFEDVAQWMEREIEDVRKVWGSGLGPRLNPAAVILSKQLPLFCAELQTLDRPRGAASDVFTLYETTGRLLEAWDDLCPDQEHGFELDAFFEPHVLAWLKDTEGNEVHNWVSRAIGMDSWVPEGESRHSQSIVDLFNFIRGSTKVVLQDLPLGEYKRAVYLVDLSRTISIAVTQYATTVNALFNNDLTPPKASTPTMELQNKLGGKAGSWLAKGQQAVKSLDKKKTEGFIVPPVACVKLTDMGAAQVSIQDQHVAMEAEETARIVKAHNLSTRQTDRPARHIFSVTVMRGQGLLGKGLSKPADAFVVVSDKENGERLLKTRTVLGAEDPRWEESFEISVGTLKTLDLSVFDRQLVGKHDALGTSCFKLDPRAFSDQNVRDVLLPLQPRGTVHLRISMEGGEKNDVAHHLAAATRALQRAEGDMMRGLVARLGDHVKTALSAQTLQGLTRPLKDKKKVKSALTEGDLESSLGTLFEYLNENFSVFSVTLIPSTRIRLMSLLWRRIIDILISLLVPPLSDKPSTHSTKDTLGSQEIDVVFKWLQMLKVFFNASENGVEHGVPLAVLQSGNYKDLVMLGQYMDLPTAQLRERCAMAVKAACKGGGGGLTNGMRGLRVDDDGGGDDNDRMAEILLRIARTRQDTSEFLGKEVATLTKARVDRQAGLL